MENFVWAKLKRFLYHKIRQGPTVTPTLGVLTLWASPGLLKHTRGATGRRPPGCPGDSGPVGENRPPCDVRRTSALSGHGGGLLPCSWRNGSSVRPAVKAVWTLDRCQKLMPSAPTRRQIRGFSGDQSQNPAAGTPRTAQQPAA